MSAATLQAPLFVQTQFNWDEEPIQSLNTALAEKPNCLPVDSKPSENIVSMGHMSVGQSSRSARSSQTANRIGGCVHVGSPLVKVLNKYGFSLDDLLVEIERQKQTTPMHTTQKKIAS
ncbi:MAG: hypothetical protein MUC43_04925 [Pirellula sp.]|jgi:hypothetical protein|nr:hypothetical protein [Pirellula sp.]